MAPNRRKEAAHRTFVVDGVETRDVDWNLHRALGTVRNDAKAWAEEAVVVLKLQMELPAEAGGGGVGLVVQV